MSVWLLNPENSSSKIIGGTKLQLTFSHSSYICTFQALSIYVVNAGAAVKILFVVGHLYLREGFKNSSSVNFWTGPLIFTPPTH